MKRKGNEKKMERKRTADGLKMQKEKERKENEKEKGKR